MSAFHHAIAISLGLAALTAGAAPSFRGPADDNPALGLSIRPLGGADPEPLPPARVHSYTFTRGDETSRRDLYDPRELWYATQWKGQWRDKAGNRLTVGRATHALPSVESPVQAGHVSRETFEQALAAPAAAFDPKQSAAPAAWAADFAGRKLGEPQKLRTGFNLSDAFFIPSDAASTLVFLFRPKNRPDWYAAIVTVADGTPSAKVRAAFEQDFLPAVRPVVNSARIAANEAKSQTLRLAPGTVKAAIPDHPSRDAAKRSIAGMKDWWCAETPEYIFLSDLRSAEGKRLIKELQANLPALRKAFSRLVPPFTEDTDVNVVRIFSEKEAYQQYVGDSHEWSSGIWSPMRRELVILGNSQERENILEIIRHEGFHQYLFYAAAKIPNALWFNEGHACFFECVDASPRGRIEIPENNRADHLLRELDAVAANIPAVLKADYAAFYNRADKQRQLNYTTAWALVYFLRKGAPSQRLTVYANVLPAYLKTLAETKDCAAATAAAFEGIDIKRLQRDFVECWKGGGRNTARRYDPLAEKAENAQR
jgi:hypothetical protein